MIFKACDFCSNLGVICTYVLAPDRPLVGLGNDEGDVHFFDDDGAWSACGDCSKLIDAEDMAGLIERAARFLPSFVAVQGTGISDTYKALLIAQYAGVMQPTTVKIPA
ncbi:hypothetical protein [Streptomyces sp. NPDC059009]|uniref:hypothetical protein n=1 Tax=Streptomyces sp. NPDC059009 TaxID=3346694 RepID=UPI00369C7D07